MMKSVQRALAFGLLVSLSGLAAAQVMLKDGHPGKYFVKNGDTLWDISARFLEEPWQLKKGAGLHLRYQFVLHAQSPKEAGVDAIYENWVK